MQPDQLLEILNLLEKLKCNTRHSWTSSGRQESVAEHSFRLAVMALLLRDEFPGVDIDRVVRMCLIHDFGEAITGDIPAFLKTDADESEEQRAIEKLLQQFPQAAREELSALYSEMDALETDESRLYKALDNLEAVIQHNEASIGTWIPLEREQNLTYGEETAEWFAYTKKLRQLCREISEQKLADDR